MGFDSIFKKNFIDSFNIMDVTVSTMFITLLTASVLALYIFFMYQHITKKTFYSKNFNISLAGVTVITSAIILTIQSNIVISLGMVGALSIVRFRTAIKDPMDLMFLFWAISIGIICGAKLPEFAILLSIFLTIGVFILNKIPLKKAPMILIVNASNIDIEEKILEIVNKNVTSYHVKSRNISSNLFDITIELRTDNSSEIVKEISHIEGVESASIISHDGDITF